MLKGHIDILEKTYIHGWAYDQEHPHDPVEVAVFHSGREIARGIANKFRNDLKKLNGSGECAFTFRFPALPDMENIAVLAIDANGHTKPLPFQGRYLALDKPPALEKKFQRDLIMWGSWPYINDYSQMTTQQLDGPVGGNVGNLVFLNAIARQLDIQKGPDWSHEPKGKGLAVIPCANQLGAHTDMDFFGALVEKTERAVVAIGLGAQSRAFEEIPQITKGTLRWLKAVVEKAPNPGHPNISLRGPFTQKVMEHYGFGNAGVVLGCPSLFTNGYRQLGRKIAKNFRKPKRVAIAAGNYHVPDLGKLEASLAKMAAETHGVYIVQHPMGMKKAARNEVADMTPWERKTFHNYALPDFSEEEEREWIHKYPRIFYNVDAWLEELRHADFVVGPRIHGVVLGLQAGVPSVCLAIDSRTRELCETMKVPWVDARQFKDGLKLDDLERLFVFDPAEFDSNRQRLARIYIEFLENNYIAPRRWLKNFTCAM